MSIGQLPPGYTVYVDHTRGTIVRRNEDGFRVVLSSGGFIDAKFSQIETAESLADTRSDFDRYLEDGEPMSRDLTADESAAVYTELK